MICKYSYPNLFGILLCRVHVARNRHQDSDKMTARPSKRQARAEAKQARQLGGTQVLAAINEGGPPSTNLINICHTSWLIDSRSTRVRSFQSLEIRQTDRTSLSFRLCTNQVVDHLQTLLLFRQGKDTDASMADPSEAALAAVAFAQYKAEKEAFVSNHTGTSLLEITALICVFPVALAVAKAFLVLLTRQLGDDQTLSAWVQFPVSFVVVVIPFVCAFTLPAYLKLLYALLIALGLSFGLLANNGGQSSCPSAPHADADAEVEVNSRRRGRSRSRTRPETKLDAPGSEPSPVRPRVALEVSQFRACTMLATCIAILAVDFQVFPRRFAKCETFGTGLMDVGTGCFVLCSAFVSRCARGSPRPPDVEMKAVLKSTWPVLAVGLLRLAVVKGVDYQVSTSPWCMTRTGRDGASPPSR
jgi:hypothetical protein